MDMIKVGIVGGTGYTGAELLRILSQHSQVEVRILTSRQEAGRRADALYPSLRGHTDLSYSVPDVAALKACDAVFFATPHGVAMEQARELLEAGVKVIDLAADFRIKDTAEFQKWYGIPHACPDLLGRRCTVCPKSTGRRLPKRA